MALFQLLPCPFRESAQTPSPPSSPTSSYYDVFLSFSGKDTRKNFTDHLYTALKQKGIIIFRDDERLERGKYISQELLKAIEETKFAIIILSTNYASSTWYLDELVKIVECMKQNMLTILPVFYHVNPSDARNQNTRWVFLLQGTRLLLKPLLSMKEIPKLRFEDLQAWKAALKEVGNIYLDGMYNNTGNTSHLS